MLKEVVEEKRCGNDEKKDVKKWKKECSRNKKKKIDEKKMKRRKLWRR